MMSTAEWNLRKDLAAAYNLAALFGWTDLIYTHISARIPDEENVFLINPFGLMFHEITPENLLKVDFDGNVLSASEYGVNIAGLIVHSAVHAARPDVQAICHFHTVNGMAISSIEEGLLPITQHACHFYGKIAYHDFNGIVMEQEEKDLIVRSLGQSNVLIMRNHGFLTAGCSIAEAFTQMYTLEKAAAAQVAAMSMGGKLIQVQEPICEKVLCQTGTNGIKVADVEWQALVRLLGPRYAQPQRKAVAVKRVAPRISSQVKMQQGKASQVRFA